MIALQVVMLFRMKGKVRFLSLALIAVCIPLGCRRDRAQGIPATPFRAELVTIPVSDGGTVCADRYGRGSRAVVLAHGGRFDKESWAKQADALARAGFEVLAIDFRGYGCSRGGTSNGDPSADLDLDLLAAVRWLREQGVTSVSILGGSMGGGAAAQASTKLRAGDLDRLILLSPAAIEHPEKMTGRKLFVTSRDDRSANGAPRLAGIRDQFERASEPKEFLLLEGSAHAQFMFESDAGDRLLQEILRFLSDP